MKKSILILSILMVYWPATYGDNVRLAHSVAFSDDLGTVARAFRSDENCAVWNYIPARYIVSGPFLQQTGYGPAANHERAYVTGLQLMTSAGVSTQDEQQLRQKILSRLREDGDCPKIKDEKSILLTPAMVQQTGVSSSNELAQLQQSDFFTRVVPTFPNEKDAYSDPNNPESVKYLADASNPDTMENLLNLQKTSQRAPVKLGSLGFYLKGIIGKVDSHLKLVGHINANFVSRLENIGCTTRDKDQSLLGGAIGPGGAGIGGLSFEEHIKECAYELRSHYQGGEFKDTFLIDHTKSQLDMDDGKPVMYELCDEKEGCTQTVKLVDFVEFRLFYEFLLSNNSYIMKVMADRTFEKDAGREGTVKSDFDVDMGYMRNFRGRSLINVPVYAKNLDEGSFSFAKLQKPFVQCLNRNYVETTKTFKNLVDSSFMPIPEKCYNENN